MPNRRRRWYRTNMASVKSKPMHFWSEEETQFMLCHLKELNILKYMDGRKTRNGDLFKKVAKQLDDAGFQRTPEQIRVRWKHLKQAYYNARRNKQTCVHNPVSSPYSDILEELLGRRPLSQAVKHSVDIEFSTSVTESVMGTGDLEETAEGIDDDEDSSESPERTPTPQQQRNSTIQLQRATSTHTSDLPGLRMSSRRGRRHVSDAELFFQKMQQMQNAWMEQIQQSQEREERLVNSIVQSNASVVSALMEGIRSLRPSVPPAPSPTPHLDRYTKYEYPAPDEHRPVYSHIVPIEEESQESKTHSEVQQMIQDRLKKIQEIKHSVDLSKRSTEKDKADSVEVFSALIRSIERSKAELLEVMEEKQKAAERQAEGLIKELEQEITVLRKRDTELEQLSHTEEHLPLLQIYSFMSSSPHTKNWTEINGDTVRTAVSQLQKTLNEKLTKTLNDKLKETVSRELKRIQQCAVDVTLDPATAHPNLILSFNGKQVTHGDTEQDLPDSPQRFNSCVSVLGKQSFSSGRFYYEVQVSGKTAWTLGFARENINRKGSITISPQNGFWTIWLRNENQYNACTDIPVALTLREKVEKVGVFMDYEEGLVSFYDVKSSSHIYSFTGQSFTENLYPFFSPCRNEGGKNSAPLSISPVFKTEYVFTSRI